MIQRMFVTLDTKKTNYKNVGKINHGDDLILELTVLSDGNMISFNDPMVDLLVKKSDGKMIRQNSGIEHIKPNKFIIEVSKDCVTSPGLSTNQLIINDNGRISTCMFYYTILNSLEEDIIESISNVEVLEQLDEFTIQMKDKMENFDEELQNRMSELEDAIDDLVEFFGDTSVDLVEAELSRNEAEQSRAQAESVRVQNENRRLQNDLDLANAEAERVRAENIRIQNEADRALVDAVMDQKESEREDSELDRIQNESKRATDELVRQQNENTRQSNETVRISNENDRKTQENRRATAETNRVNAETTRRNNENSRISNETERQKTMNEMKSLIGNVNDFDERVGVIEDEIEEINSSLDDIVNKQELFLEDFGANGDGVTNDSVALQKAVEYSNNNKTTIFLKPKKYIINDIINFKNYISLKCIDTNKAYLIFGKNTNDKLFSLSESINSVNLNLDNIAIGATTNLWNEPINNIDIFNNCSVQGGKIINCMIYGANNIFSNCSFGAYFRIENTHLCKVNTSIFNDCRIGDSKMINNYIHGGYTNIEGEYDYSYLFYNTRYHSFLFTQNWVEFVKVSNSLYGSLPSSRFENNQFDYAYSLKVSGIITSNTFTNGTFARITDNISSKKGGSINPNYLTIIDVHSDNIISNNHFYEVDEKTKIYNLVGNVGVYSDNTSSCQNIIINNNIYPMTFSEKNILYNKTADSISTYRSNDLRFNNIDLSNYIFSKILNIDELPPGVKYKVDNKDIIVKALQKLIDKNYYFVPFNFYTNKIIGFDNVLMPFNSTIWGSNFNSELNKVIKTFDSNQTGIKSIASTTITVDSSKYLKFTVGESNFDFIYIDEYDDSNTKLLSKPFLPLIMHEKIYKLQNQTTKIKISLAVNMSNHANGIDTFIDDFNICCM